MKVLKVKRILLISVFIIAFLIRLAVGLYGYKNEVWNTFADDNARLVHAQAIIENGFFEDFRPAESVFAPVIPTVLAMKIIIFGDSWLPVFMLNALLGSISCLLIYYIALHFFSKKISFLAFIWAAFYPNFIRYVGTAGNEPWLVFLFALTFLFAFKAIETKKISYFIILYSLFFTLLFNTDERYISYSLLFSMFLFIGNSNISLKFKKATVFVLLTIFISTPWLIRNYIVYDDIVIISCRTTNLTKYVFNHREELMFFDHSPNNTYLSHTQIDSVQKGFLMEFSAGKPISDLQINAIKSGNIPHSFTSVEKVFSRIHFLWMPFKLKDHYRLTGYNFMAAWSLKHNLLTGLSYGLLLPFVLLALVVLIKQKRWKETWLFVGIMFYHTFLHVAFIPYTRDRYRHPIDFAIIILGCYGLWITYYYIKSKLSVKKEIETI